MSNDSSAGKDFEEGNDSIGAFIRFDCAVTGDPEDKCLSKPLYEAYLRFCDRKGLTPFGLSTFNRRLADAAKRTWKSPGGQMRQFERRRSNGTFYAGIRIREQFGAGNAGESNERDVARPGCRRRLGAKIGLEPGGINIDRLDRLTAIVDRTRLALGANAARELWLMLGLPPLRTSSKRAVPRESEPDLLSRLDDAGSGGALPTSTGFQPFEAKLPREYVAAFMRECCERDPEAETSSRVFRQSYVAWADRRGAPVPMACVLGKYAIGLGLRKRKAKGSSIYLGLRIRPQEIRSGAAAGV